MANNSHSFPTCVPSAIHAEGVVVVAYKAYFIATYRSPPAAADHTIPIFMYGIKSHHYTTVSLLY
eukprot:scaffold243308_cov20-Prasinocladus_malaysianus.AAC.3